MADSPEDYELFHYGVKGMKWGVRKKRDKSRTGPYQPPKTKRPTDREIREAKKNVSRVRGDVTRARKKHGDQSDQHREALERKRQTEAVANKMTKRKKIGMTAYGAAYGLLITEVATGGSVSSAAVRSAKAGHNFMNRPAVKSTMLKAAYKAGSAVYKGRKFVQNLMDPNTVAGQVVQRSIGR